MKLSPRDDESQLSPASMEHCLHLELWRGNVAGAVQMARERNEISDWLVSMAPLASYDLWELVSAEYAEKLEEEGQYHKAVTYLLAANKVNQAIDLFRRHRLFREAVSLTRLRLHPSDSMLEDLYTEWGQSLMKEGHFQQAAQCYLAMRHIQEAEKVKSHRQQLLSETSTSATPPANETLRGLAYPYDLLSRHLEMGQWSEAYTFLRDHESLKALLPLVSTHQSLVQQLTGLAPGLTLTNETVTPEVVSVLKNKDGPSDKTGFPEFLLDKSDIDPVVPWEPVLIGEHTFPHHLLRVWHQQLNVTMATQELKNMHAALSQLTSLRQKLNDLPSILVLVSLEVTLCLVTLLMSETSSAIRHFLQVVSTLHQGGHKLLLRAMCCLMLPQGPKYLLKLQQEFTACRVLLTMESHGDVNTAGGENHNSIKRFLTEIKDDSAISMPSLRCRELDCLRAYYYLAILDFLSDSSVCAQQENDSLDGMPNGTIFAETNLLKEDTSENKLNKKPETNTNISRTDSDNCEILKLSIHPTKSDAQLTNCKLDESCLERNDRSLTTTSCSTLPSTPVQISSSGVSIVVGKARSKDSDRSVTCVDSVSSDTSHLIVGCKARSKDSDRSVTCGDSLSSDIAHSIVDCNAKSKNSDSSFICGDSLSGNTAHTTKVNKHCDNIFVHGCNNTNSSTDNDADNSVPLSSESPPSRVQIVEGESSADSSPVDSLLLHSKLTRLHVSPLISPAYGRNQILTKPCLSSSLSLPINSHVSMSSSNSPLSLYTQISSTLQTSNSPLISTTSNSQIPLSLSNPPSKLYTPNLSLTLPETNSKFIMHSLNSPSTMYTSNLPLTLLLTSHSQITLPSSNSPSTSLTPNIQSPKPTSSNQHLTLFASSNSNSQIHVPTPSNSQLDALTSSNSQLHTITSSNSQLHLPTLSNSPSQFISYQLSPHPTPTSSPTPLSPSPSPASPSPSPNLSQSHKNPPSERDSDCTTQHKTPPSERDSDCTTQHKNPPSERDSDCTTQHKNPPSERDSDCTTQHKNPPSERDSDCTMQHKNPPSERDSDCTTQHKTPPSERDSDCTTQHKNPPSERDSDCTTQHKTPHSERDPNCTTQFNNRTFVSTKPTPSTHLTTCKGQLNYANLLRLSKGILWDIQAKREALTETLGHIHQAISQRLLNKHPKDNTQLDRPSLKTFASKDHIQLDRHSLKTFASKDNTQLDRPSLKTFASKDNTQLDCHSLKTFASKDKIQLDRPSLKTFASKDKIQLDRPSLKTFASKDKIQLDRPSLKTFASKDKIQLDRPSLKTFASKDNTQLDLHSSKRVALMDNIQLELRSLKTFTKKQPLNSNPNNEPSFAFNELEEDGGFHKTWPQPQSAQIDAEVSSIDSSGKSSRSCESCRSTPIPSSLESSKLQFLQPEFGMRNPVCACPMDKCTERCMCQTDHSCHHQFRQDHSIAVQGEQDQAVSRRSRKVIWMDGKQPNMGDNVETNMSALHVSRHTSDGSAIPVEWDDLPVDLKYSQPYVTLPLLTHEQEAISQELKRVPDMLEIPFPSIEASVRSLLHTSMVSSHISAHEKKLYLKQLDDWASLFSVTSRQQEDTEAMFVRAAEEYLVDN